MRHGANLFLASEETLKASRKAGNLILDCRWAEPFVDGGGIASRWKGHLAAFEEMEIDRERQRVFLYDYDRKAEAVHDVTTDQILRQEFADFWLGHHPYGPHDEDVWRRLRKKFRLREIMLPIQPNQGGGPAQLLNAIYSASEGRPVGWDFSKLIEVVHRIADGHKGLLRAFRFLWVDRLRYFQA